MSEKSSGSGLLMVGGLIFGGIIIVIALKNRQQQQFSQLSQPPPASILQTSDIIATLKPYIEDAIESAIKKATVQVLSPANTYKNNEDRIVRRNADGFIESLKVIRHAEMVNNAAPK